MSVLRLRVWETVARVVRSDLLFQTAVITSFVNYLSAEIVTTRQDKTVVLLIPDTDPHTLSCVLNIT